MTTLNPTEQLALEMINRARMDPDAEVARIAQEAGVPFTSLNQFIQGTSSGYPITSTSKQVLAGNNALTLAAEGHSRALYSSGDIQNGGDVHNGAGDGTPGSRIAGVGYQENPLSYYRPENVAVLWTTNQLTPSEIMADTVTMHDNLFYDDPAKMFGEPGGHRLAMLDDNMKEIGIGEATGTVIRNGVTYNSVDLTEDFGVTGTSSFLTGAVYNDVNLGKLYDRNWFYDANGAVAGATATVTTTTGQTIGSDTTGSGGGWSVAEPGGTYNVTFTGPGIAAGGVTVTVEGGNRNAKVDLVNGNDIYSNVSTTLGAGAKDLHLLGIDNINATGNALDNIFYVNKGSHTINGGGGFDTVVYSGNEASYTLTSNADGSLTVAGANGTDHLISISQLQFADQSYTVPGTSTNGDHPPVVTAHDVSVAAGTPVSIASLFTAQDPDGRAITKYMFLDDGNNGDYLTVNGRRMASHTWITVDASQLGSVEYVGGSTPGSEKLYIAAYDGKEYSANASLMATTVGTANVNHAPVVTTHDVSVDTGTPVSLSSLFNVQDPDGDSIAQYMFMDDGSSGHFENNGVTLASHTWQVVDAADLGKIKYVGDAPGSDKLYVTAYDGKDWSANAALIATSIGLARPEVSGHDTSVAANATTAITALFTAHQASDSITEYMFMDDGSAGGHLEVNGRTMASHTWISVDAANLGSVNYVAGPGAGSELLHAAVFDGHNWSANASSTVGWHM
jgi:hypothetical protein